MFQDVVIALKPGLPSRPLLELARVATRPPARLHLVSLVRVGGGGELEELEQVQSDVEALAVDLRREGYEASVRVGPVAVAAAADINSIIDERGADLVIIGLAKRTRVSKALIGSDAQRVILSAGCPVLSTPLDPSLPG